METATKTQLLHYKDYVAGWLDSSVHDSLEVFLGGSASTAFALITCLDSNLDPKSLLAGNAGLQSALKGAKPLGKGLLLPSRSFLTIVRQGLPDTSEGGIGYWPRSRARRS